MRIISPRGERVVVSPPSALNSALLPSPDTNHGRTRNKDSDIYFPDGDLAISAAGATRMFLVHRGHVHGRVT